MSDADALAQASAFLNAHHPVEARRLIGLHLARYPDDKRANRLLAQSLIALGERDRARDAAQRAIELDPDDEWGWRLLSLAESALGNGRAARQAGEKARELAPQLWMTHTNLAIIDVAAKQITKDTHDSVARAYALAPDNPSVVLTAGNVALAANDLDAAKRAYETVLGVDPTNENARNNLAVIELRRHRSGSAAATFMELLADDPTRAIAERNLRLAARRALALIQLAVVVGSLVILLYCTFQTSFSTPAAFAVGLKPVIFGCVLAEIITALTIVLRFRATSRGRFRKFLVGIRATSPGAVVWAAILALGILITALLLALPTEIIVASRTVIVLVVLATLVAARIARRTPKRS